MTGKIYRDKNRRWRWIENDELICADGPIKDQERRWYDSAKRAWRRDQDKVAATLYNRRWNFKNKYGITLEQYDEMRAAQDYRCAICGLHEDELPRALSRKRRDGSQDLGSALAVDHCHASGRIRKLLCMKCNQGIGAFRENAEILESAARYVREVCPVDPE
jgi:hypothetical protein